MHIFLRKFLKLQLGEKIDFFQKLDRCQESNLNTYRSGLSVKQFGKHGSAKISDGKAYYLTSSFFCNPSQLHLIPFNCTWFYFLEILSDLTTTAASLQKPQFDFGLRESLREVVLRYKSCLLLPATTHLPAPRA